jgi:hypothetical protein
VATKYHLPVNRLLPDYTWREMALLSNKILTNVFSKGSIVSVQSFINLFDPIAIEKIMTNLRLGFTSILDNKKLLKIGDKIFAYLNECEGVCINSVCVASYIIDVKIDISVDVNSDIYLNEMNNYLATGQIDEINNKVSLLKIYQYLLFTPTRYFTRYGCIILPFNADVCNYEFYRNGRRLFLDPDDSDDEEQKLVDRDSLEVAFTTFRENYYRKRYPWLLDNQYLNDNTSLCFTGVRKLCMDFVSTPFTPDPVFSQMVASFNRSILKKRHDL